MGPVTCLCLILVNNPKHKWPSLRVTLLGKFGSYGPLVQRTISSRFYTSAGKVLPLSSDKPLQVNMDTIQQSMHNTKYVKYWHAFKFMSLQLIKFRTQLKTTTWIIVIHTTVSVCRNRHLFRCSLIWACILQQNSNCLQKIVIYHKRRPITEAGPTLVWNIFRLQTSI